MTVDTKSVQGRRKVRYQTLDDLVSDAEGLVSGEVKMVGNWSLGQILSHLSKAFTSSIDGAAFSVPLPVRLVMRFVMKKRFLTKGLPSGFKLPPKAASFLPDELSAYKGLDQLRRSVKRLKNEPHRAKHPIFGRLTNNEWNQFHLRHAEMHMSFAVLDSK